MHCSLPKIKMNSRTYNLFINPLKWILPYVSELSSRGYRPLKMTFEDQLNALIYFHLQEHTSARHLVQDLKDNDFARQCIAPDGGISRSSFSEAINNRGLEQLKTVFQELCKRAESVLPKEHTELGSLVSIDGSLIDAVLSMYWADYRKGSQKAKGHFGFNINQGIPTQKVFLTEGNGAERPFVSRILSPGQTGVMDRGYQCHKDFDLLQTEGKHFVCRIKISTTRTVIKENSVDPDSFVFYDAEVLLGTPGQNQTEKPVRVVGYEVEGVKYFVATDRHDLTAEQVATVYKLRWRIETFFKWWKKTFESLSPDRQKQIRAHGSDFKRADNLSADGHLLPQTIETVSIRRIRELRATILNELYGNHQAESDEKNIKEQKSSHAKT